MLAFFVGACRPRIVHDTVTILSLSLYMYISIYISIKKEIKIRKCAQESWAKVGQKLGKSWAEKTFFKNFQKISKNVVKIVDNKNYMSIIIGVKTERVFGKGEKRNERNA